MPQATLHEVLSRNVFMRFLRKLVRHLVCVVLWRLENKSVCSGHWYVLNLFQLLKEQFRIQGGPKVLQLIHSS